MSKDKKNTVVETKVETTAIETPTVIEMGEKRTRISTDSLLNGSETDKLKGILRLTKPCMVEVFKLVSQTVSNKVALAEKEISKTEKVEEITKTLLKEALPVIIKDYNKQSKFEAMSIEETTKVKNFYEHCVEKYAKVVSKKKELSLDMFADLLK